MTHSACWEEIKPHDLTVPYGDRGGVVIEPMLTDQWYARADVLANGWLKRLRTAVHSVRTEAVQNTYFS
ncbi:hypothetical protein ACVXG9_02240 [Escherichia coli]